MIISPTQRKIASMVISLSLFALGVIGLKAAEAALVTLPGGSEEIIWLFPFIMGALTIYATYHVVFIALSIPRLQALLLPRKKKASGI